MILSSLGLDDIASEHKTWRRNSLFPEPVWPPTSMWQVPDLEKSPHTICPDMSTPRMKLDMDGRDFSHSMPSSFSTDRSARGTSIPTKPAPCSIRGEVSQASATCRSADLVTIEATLTPGPGTTLRIVKAGPMM